MPALADLVRVLSTTTGTGTITLGSAVQGFLTPSQAGMVDGGIYSYAIEADFVTSGDDLVATSRETGIGTYTASGTTLSRAVQKSTNSNALLSLAGDAQVIITPITISIREALTAARTYYVRTDGSNSNSGLVNSAGGAFLTVQKAFDVILASLDLSGFDVTIQCGNGTYAGAVVTTSKQVGKGTIYIKGNAGDASLVKLTGGVSLFFVDAFIQDLEISNASGGGLHCSEWALVGFSNLRFGTVVNNQLDVDTYAYVYSGDNYAIIGGGASHISVTEFGLLQIYQAITVTITGTPAFSTAFINCNEFGSAEVGILGTITFSGSATGPRYYIAYNSVVLTGSNGDPNYFPGNALGTLASGGVYDNSDYGQRLLASGTASNVSSLDIVLTSYTQYRAISVEFHKLIPATAGAALYLRFSTNGGSTYNAGSSDYLEGALGASAGGGGFSFGGTVGQIQIVDDGGDPGGFLGGVVGRVTIFNQADTGVSTSANYSVTVTKSGGDYRTWVGGGYRLATQDTDAIRFLFSSGNISSVKYAVYGHV